MQGYKKLKLLAEEQYQCDIARATTDRDSRLKAIEYVRELSNEARRSAKSTDKAIQP